MALSTPNAKFTEAGVSHPIFNVPSKAVPNSGLTSEISADCWLRHLEVTNVGAVSRNLTLQDGAGNLIENAFAIAAGAQLVYDYDRPGRYCQGGIQWLSSGGTDLQGHIIAEPYSAS